MARAHLDNPLNSDCGCPACRMVGAADKYTPSADATADGVDSVRVSIEKHATNPVVLGVSKPVGRGRKWTAQRWLSIAEARAIAHALHAAADAAEETTR